MITHPHPFHALQDLFVAVDEFVKHADHDLEVAEDVSTGVDLDLEWCPGCPDLEVVSQKGEE